MRRWLGRAALSLALLVAVWLALHVHPQPLFAHQLQVGTVVLHARQPLPPRAAALLEDVEARLRTSPLYRPGVAHHVFLCDTPALYAFFSPHHPRTGGETYFWLGNHVFLRPVDVEGDRLIGPSGNPVAPPRTLTYFLAHELVHTLQFDALGLRGYLALERWQEDGYADFVANPAFDAADALAKLRAHDASMDPARSGLYLRWHLLVHHELARGVSVKALLEAPRSPAEIEAELLR
ncbi:MAG: hypothetical protein ACOZQL_42750 [Myxococcota bacterium]